jgi:hypothetical protein
MFIVFYPDLKKKSLKKVFTVIVFLNYRRNVTHTFSQKPVETGIMHFRFRG